MALSDDGQCSTRVTMVVTGSGGLDALAGGFERGGRVEHLRADGLADPLQIGLRLTLGAARDRGGGAGSAVANRQAQHQGDTRGVEVAVAQDTERLAEVAVE